MMMHLPPLPRDQPEDPARPDRHAEDRPTRSILSPLPAYDVEDLPRLVIAVAVELEPERLRVAENLRVHRLDLAPSALDAAHRVVHHGVIGLRPVPRHQVHVAVVQGLVELGQCAHLRGKLLLRFSPGDGRLLDVHDLKSSLSLDHVVRGPDTAPLSAVAAAPPVRTGCRCVWNGCMPSPRSGAPSARAARTWADGATWISPWRLSGVST